MKSLLAFAGRNGPVLLFAGVFVGLLFPSLAERVRPLMPAAVFAFTLGAFLKVEMWACREDLARPIRLALVLAWVGAGVPLATWALTRLLPLPAAIRTGMLLCMLAPPVGSAAAIAAMLRLNPALALSVSVGLSLLSPLLLPPAALALGGIELHLDAGGMMLRLAVVVLGAAAAAAALRRLARDLVVDNPYAMTGVSVAGLIVVAIGAMHGERQQLMQHGLEVAEALGVAFALNAGFQAVGSLLFATLGWSDALTVGLLSGNRNVTLVWVAAAPWLHSLPGVERYLAASIFPIFMLPLVFHHLARRWRGAGPAGSARPPAMPPTVHGAKLESGPSVK